MKKMYLSMFLSLAMTAVYCAETKIQPSAEGMIVDRNNDGVADTVLVQNDKQSVLELLAGSLGNTVHKTVLEYRLPEKAQVSKATLTLSLNGNSGCHPDKPGTSGPEIEIWFYDGTDANDKIELTDDGPGEKLGVAIERAPREDARKPIVIDVTAAVKKAVERNSTSIGFRLEPVGEKSNTAWRIRSSEFARKYTASAFPTLTIISE